MYQLRALHSLVWSTELTQSVKQGKWTMKNENHIRYNLTCNFGDRQWDSTTSALQVEHVFSQLHCDRAPLATTVSDKNYSWFLPKSHIRANLDCCLPEFPTLTGESSQAFETHSPPGESMAFVKNFPSSPMYHPTFPWWQLTSCRWLTARETIASPRPVSNKQSPLARSASWRVHQVRLHVFPAAFNVARGGIDVWIRGAPWV